MKIWNDNNKICSNLKCKNLLTNSVIFPIITTLVTLIMWRVSEPGRGKQEILKKMKKVLDESKMVRYND